MSPSRFIFHLSSDASSDRELCKGRPILCYRRLLDDGPRRWRVEISSWVEGADREAESEKVFANEVESGLESNLKEG